MALPAGFTVDDDEDKKNASSGLPAGFTLDTEPAPIEEEIVLPRAEGYQQVGGEALRGAGRGGLNAWEFYRDVLDTAAAPMDAQIKAYKEGRYSDVPGDALSAWWEQINPLGADSERDVLRQQEYADAGITDTIKQQYEHPLATAMQWGTEAALTGGGKVLPRVIEGVGTGGGAAFGEWLGGDTGELIGGLFGGLTTPAIVDNVLSRVKNTRIFSQGKSAQDDVVRQLRKTMTDEDVAKYEKARKAGVEGTPADLTGEQRMFDLEEIAQQDPDAARVLQTQTDARHQQTVDELSGVFGDADPRAARRGAQQTIDESLAAIDQRAGQQGQRIDIDQAEQLRQIDVAENFARESAANAQQQRGLLAPTLDAVQKQGDEALAGVRAQGAEDIAGANRVQQFAREAQSGAEDAARIAEDAARTVGGDVAESSVELVNRYGALDADLYENLVHPAWRQFDDVAGGTDGNTARGIADDFLTGLDNETDKLLLNREHSDVFSLIDNWKDRPVKPSEIQSVITRINDKHAAATASGSLDNVTRQLKSMSKKFDNYLEEMGGTGDAYKKAKAASREYFERVKPDRVRKARLKDPEGVGKRLFVAGPEGRAAANQIADSKDQNVIDGMKDYIRAQGDNVTPAFMKKYEDFLSHPAFRDVQQEMDGIVARQQKATDAGTALKETMRATRKAEAEAAKVRGGATRGVTEQTKQIAKDVQAKQKEITSAADEVVGEVNRATAQTGMEGGRARTALDQTMKTKRGELTTKVKGLKNAVAKSDAAAYANKPNETLNSILNRQDDAADALESLAANVNDPEAFARHLGDVITERLSTDAFGKQGVNAQAMSKWGDISEKVSKVLTPDQMSGINDAMVRTMTDVLRRRGTQGVMDSISHMPTDMAVNVLSASIASMLPGTHTLMYGGLIRRTLQKQIGNKRSAKAEAELIKAFADPAKMDKLVQRMQRVPTEDVSAIGNVIRLWIAEENDAAQ